MSQTNTYKQTLSPTDAWLLSHVTGLLEYTKQDDMFAFQLASQLKNRHWKNTVIHDMSQYFPFLTPADQEDATIIADWLLRNLDNNPTARSTRGILVNWAQNYESPKDLIFGIVGLAVIGPTLGLIKRKKKQRSQMHVVINETWNNRHNQNQRLDLIQKLSMRVIANELKFTGGNVYELHPDSAEWCLEEPLTKIYQSHSTELCELLATLRFEGLSHYAHTENDNLVALAISPTVNDNVVKDFQIKIFK